MNFSKLFLLTALGLSLNNGACGMNQNNKKKIYDEKASQKLHQAVENNNLDLNLIRSLLEQNADPNIEYRLKWTPLHCAAWNGNNECVQLLINNGADVNAQDNDGWTPLYDVARSPRRWNGHKECAELLLSNGADINIQDHKGRTPLHMAAYCGKKECVELFLALSSERVTCFAKHNKAFNQQCFMYLLCSKRNLGKTHLKVPIKVPKFISFEILSFCCPYLENLINMKNKEGQTALDLARKAGHKEVVELIEEFKRKNNFKRLVSLILSSS